MHELNQTARVVLGLVGAGVTTGYEMKAVVDRWTRFFWGASIGGIYPELQRLEAAGLVAGSDDPAGGRRRRRYVLTDEGRAALDAWLRDDTPSAFELRHEGMLRMFFSAGLDAQARASLLARLAAQHAALADRLDAEVLPPPEEGDELARLTLDFGRDLNRFIADWFRGAAQR